MTTGRSHSVHRVIRLGRRMLWIAAALLFVAGGAGVSSLRAEGLSVRHLRCEYLTDPLGIDTRQPRLSWIVTSDERAQTQTAYRVLVASSAARLSEEKGDLWDSGKVPGDRTAQVVYEGRPLESRQGCWWKVRAWDRDGEASQWSEPGHWEMGMLSRDDWKGRWIGRTPSTDYRPAPYFRKDFEVESGIRRARLVVSGLGYHEVTLNGHRVGDHVLDPGYTRYDKRVLYVTHDVTSMLLPGRNAIGVILGTGWYNVHTRAVWYFDKAPWRAAPRLLLDLWVEYEDGRIETLGTDGSWKTSTGPVVYDSIYGGETYDARLEKPGWNLLGYDDSDWENARLVDPPGGTLAAQQMHPIRIRQTITPVKVTEPKPGVFVYDLGQNIAGVAELRISGPAGTRISMKYAEKLHPDGTVDNSNIRQHMVDTDPPQRFQTDEYVLAGEGRETWKARFVYHGFQYVEVTGAPGKLTLDNLRGHMLSSDVPAVGEFECSNPLLNRILACAKRAYLSNLEGIPTDCPHREKNGWTGDAHLAAEQGLFQFDAVTVYTKWIQDLDDEQRKADEGKRHKGELPGIVPTSGWGYDWGNGPAWDSAFLLIPWYLYQFYGDTRILEEHYDDWKLYVDYLTRRSEGNLVSIGLGDWCPFKTKTPVEVTSSGYYYRDARILAETAKMLGKTDDWRKYSELAREIRRAFNAKFHDEESGLYANGSQTALGCALYQGFVDEEHRARVLERLVEKIEACDGHLDFGILGSKYVLNALLEGGRSDVVYTMASKTTHPSWGNWLERGATTLWEDWGGGASRNHIMFGDICAWFFRALGGIREDPESPGFGHFIIRPEPVGDLTWARAAYRSIRGRIASEWRKDGAAFHLKVTVPANTSATVYLPASADSRIEEGGASPGKAEGVKLLRREEGRAVLEVGSGSYEFEVRPE